MILVSLFANLPMPSLRFSMQSQPIVILSSVCPSSPPVCYHTLLPRVSHCLFAIYRSLLLPFPTTCHCTTKAPNTFYSPIWPHTTLHQDSGSSPRTRQQIGGSICAILDLAGPSLKFLSPCFNFTKRSCHSGFLHP